MLALYIKFPYALFPLDVSWWKIYSNTVSTLDNTVLQFALFPLSTEIKFIMWKIDSTPSAFKTSLISAGYESPTLVYVSDVIPSLSSLGIIFIVLWSGVSGTDIICIWLPPVEVHFPTVLFLSLLDTHWYRNDAPSSFPLIYADEFWLGIDCNRYSLNHLFLRVYFTLSKLKYATFPLLPQNIATL